MGRKFINIKVELIGGDAVVKVIRASIMTILFLNLTVFAGGRVGAGDWDKTYDKTYIVPDWRLVAPMKTTQFLEFNEDNMFKTGSLETIDRVTITEIDYVKNICFEVKGEKARCVSVTWLYEFLKMMNP
jgi:hypothetical protein